MTEPPLVHNEVLSNVKKILIGKHTLYQGDCRDSLQMIDDNSVHLIVTSPPYNVGIAYNSSDDNLPFDKYIAFTRAWLTECYRVLMNGGRLCVNVPIDIFKNHPSSLMFVYASLMKQIGFYERDLIIWVKKRNCDGQLLRKKRIYGTWTSHNPILHYPSEAIIVMSKTKLSLEGHNSDVTHQEFLQWRYNIWEIDTEANRTHPAPFPPELPKRLIKLYSFPRQTVLDPFLGSGTTMKVADELNRTCIGCEVDELYVKMTVERMRNLNLTPSSPFP